jgi:hypothetical protein
MFEGILTAIGLLVLYNYKRIIDTYDDVTFKLWPKVDRLSIRLENEVTERAKLTKRLAQLETKIAKLKGR